MNVCGEWFTRKLFGRMNDLPVPEIQQYSSGISTSYKCCEYNSTVVVIFISYCVVYLLSVVVPLRSWTGKVSAAGVGVLRSFNPQGRRPNVGRTGRPLAIGSQEFLAALFGINCREPTIRPFLLLVAATCPSPILPRIRDVMTCALSEAQQTLECYERRTFNL